MYVYINNDKSDFKLTELDYDIYYVKINKTNLYLQFDPQRDNLMS